MVSSNVCGSIFPCTFDGKKYFVSFIDHYSHFAVCYLITNKNEVFDKLETYVAVIETKFGTRIKNLRCHNGGEYCSKKLQNFANKK